MRRHERCVAYGVGGWVFEVLFTGLKGPVRDGDKRLAAHTYLWMFPVYGSAAYLFEPAHDALRDRPWWQRGARPPELAVPLRTGGVGAPGMFGVRSGCARAAGSGLT